MYFSILTLFFIALEPASSYKITLNATYQGSNFFSAFNFFTEADPTDGYVNYVDYATALNESLISVKNGMAYIGADAKNKATGRGRDSVRLESKAVFNSGVLIIADIAHMPSGCGTWPAFWLVGPSWPYNGEIDIIEGVNNLVKNQMTLHTEDGCAMNVSLANQMTGTWTLNMENQPSNNCYINAANQYSNAGCGVIGGPGSYGSPFNSQQGGVYATLWTNSEISVYFFNRSSIPKEITNKAPDPTKWGKPMAKFQIGTSTNCPSSYFSNQKLIINLTFCGDWAGSVFSNMCPNLGSCETYVKNNPSAFREAYWSINSINIYKVV